ncbi:BLUF domain-containing protein [Nocardioides campestrisoli]|uniref:BLUF domain-containing protein n=1 Tax=Nocardioides campestrisoli TaxID=2736757 RepID=UPI0015E73CB2|nr:BLUF domain-containing protein [Nocardioides campestrisoli]
MLFSLTYFSSATTEFSAADLKQLLATVRPRNAADDITGMLLYHDGSFAQALEGPAEQVRRTFDRICLDRRHRGIYVAFEDEITERAFPDWAMSFRDLGGAAAREAEGFSTFVQDVRAGRPVPGDTAPHHLLRAFSRPVL